MATFQSLVCQTHLASPRLHAIDYMIPSAADSNLRTEEHILVLSATVASALEESVLKSIRVKRHSIGA